VQQQQQQQHAVSHKEDSPATAGATTDTNAHERAVSPPGSSSSTEIEQGTNKRKRKKEKKDKAQGQAQSLQQQLAAIAAAADGASPAAVFDETLLAVIGILHAARLQCNVAGWLRAGALFSPPPFSERATSSVMGASGDAKTWCDDPVLVRAWASRGREAMHELGLKVEHGVES
jgi:hypothetical protein